MNAALAIILIALFLVIVYAMITLPRSKKELEEENKAQTAYIVQYMKAKNRRTRRKVIWRCANIAERRAVKRLL